MNRNDKLIWFDVDVFADALDAAINDARGIVKKAIYSTMGKSRRRARASMSSMIRERWNIRKKDLDTKIRVKIGSRSGTYESFEMIIKGASLSLSYFGATQYSGVRRVSRSGTKTMKRKSKFQGVEVTVLRGKKTRLTNAFMQSAASGHLMVLRRKGRARYPIEAKAVISPASMFDDGLTADRFEDDVMDYVERTFAHELEWRLQRAGLT